MPRPFLYVTHPKTKLLTTRARFIEETGSTASTTLIDRMIERSSSEIESRLGRRLARAQITDRFQGVGLREQVLSVAPLIDIVAGRYDGTAEDITDWEPANENGEEGGILYNPDAFPSVRFTSYTTNTRPLWEVDFWGGFLLPGDDVLSNATITAAASDDSFNLPAGTTWPLLRPDDWIEVSGWADTENNGYFKVVTRADQKVVVDASLVDAGNSPAETITVKVSTLPGDIERACILMTLVGLASSAESAEGLVKVSERVGDLSVSYAQGEGRRAIDQLLMPHQRFL